MLSNVVHHRPIHLQKTRSQPSGPRIRHFAFHEPPRQCRLRRKFRSGRHVDIARFVAALREVFMLDETLIHQRSYTIVQAAKTETMPLCQFSLADVRLTLKLTQHSKGGVFLKLRLSVCHMNNWEHYRPAQPTL
jgi:hypothetical protein